MKKKSVIERGIYCVIYLILVCTLSITVSATDPSITITSPTFNQNANISTSIEIAATVTDDGTIDIVRADITLPNSTIQQLTLSDQGGDKYNNSFTVPPVNGAYNVSIVANDTLGNSNTQSTEFQGTFGDPTNFDGLRVWYDATDITTLFTNDACTSAVSSAGDTVSCWMDKSGNNHNATSVSGKGTPVYAENVFNGLGVVNFSKSDSDTLRHELASQYTSDFTIFIVLQSKDTSPETYESFFSNGEPASTDHFQIDYTNDSGVNSFRYGASTKFNFEEFDNEIKLYSVTHDGNNIELFNDGTSVNTGSTTEGRIFEHYRINQNRNGDRHHDSFIGEIILYDHAISGCEQENVNVYLGDKYGKDFFGISNNYSLGAPYNNDVNGIGEFDSDCSDSIEFTSAQSSIVTISNPTALDIDDVMTIAHNGTDFTLSTEVPSPYTHRINQVWRVDHDNDVGNVSISFNIEGLGLNTDSTDRYALLIDTDETLSDATTHTLGVSIDGNTVTFTDISFTHGEYFTLAYSTHEPSIFFVSPTASNHTKYDNIYINITSSSDTTQHYTLTDFDNTLHTWFRFDDINSSGDPTDLSTHGRNASLQNGALINATGRFGDAIHFDGSNDYVDLPEINTDFTGGLSMCVWTYWNSFSESWSRIADFGEGQADDNILFAHVGTSTDLAFEVYNGGTGGNRITASSSLLTQTWQHLCITQNSTGHTIIYINGTNTESGTANVPSTVTREDSFLGRSNWGSDGYFNGAMDEFILFNRTLSEVEILSIYNASANRYEHNFTSVIEGNHTITGYSVDTTGLKNQTETRTILVDLTPPAVIPHAPDDGSIHTIYRDIEIAANVTDVFAILSVVANITLPNGTVQQLTLSNEQNNKYNSSYTIPPLTGTYTVLFIANDSVNSNNTESIQFEAIGLPGAVSNNLEFWLDAKQTRSLFTDSCGGTQATDATDIACWQDLSGNERHMESSGSNKPRLRTEGDNLINTNNILRFDGGDEYLEDADGENYINGLSAFSTFALIDSDVAAADRYIYNAESDTTNAESPWGLRFDDAGALSGQDNTLKYGINTGSVTLYEGNESGLTKDTPLLTTQQWESGESPSLFIDARYISPHTETTKSGTLTSANYVRIGHQGGHDHWDGSISELIHYNTKLNATDQNKVESYLAIKYGITLTSTVNYVDSSNNTVYNTTGTHLSYQHDIAGIGRDDIGALGQYTSTSSNKFSIITISNLSSVQDREFLIWGNDNETTEEVASNVPFGAVNRVNRTWRVDQKGSVGSVNVSFNISGLSVTGTGTDDFFLAVDPTDSNFTTGATQYAASMFSNGIVTFDSVTFTGDDYFILVTSDDITPPSVTSLIPSQGSKFNGSDSIELAATVTDELSNVSTVLAELELPNGTVQTATLTYATGSKYNSSFTLPSIAGAYTLTIVANDTKNNINNTESILFLIELNDPLDITGILGWYDGADNETLYTDTSCSTLVTTHNDQVHCWKNKAPGNNATVVSGKNASLFKSDSTDRIGPSTTLRFNKSQETIYETGIDIRADTNEDVTIFSVYRPRTNTTTDQGQAIWGNDNGAWDRFYYTLFSENVGLGTDGIDDGLISLGGASNGLSIDGAGIVDTVFLLAAVYDGNVTSGVNTGPTNQSRIYFDGELQREFTDQSDDTAAQTQLFLGWDGDNGAYDGDLAEIIVYDSALNLCQIQLVNNYLGPKYGKDFSGISNDYGHSAPHDNDINGISEYVGNCSVSTEVTSAQSSIATIFNSNSLDLNDSLTFAHDNTGFNTVNDVPSPYHLRIDQSWRVDVDNEPGNVSLSFDLASVGFSTTDRTFALLIDTDTTFSNANIHTTGYIVSAGVVTFENVSFSNGDYFTLAYSIYNPSVTFVDPTPQDSANLTTNNFFSNISSSADEIDHYTFIDYDYTLTAWYRFDDTNGSGHPTDLSTYSNNGSLEGDALINSSGLFGDALHLDGTGDYVNTGISANINTADLTVSAWIRLNTLTQDDSRIVADDDNDQGWALSYGDTSTEKRIRFFMRGMDTTSLDADNVIQEANTWYHVVAVLDTINNSRYIYINGTLVGSLFSDTGSATGDSGPLTIGSESSASGESDTDLDGSIDEVLIFNRTLTPNEILSLYNATANQYKSNFTNLAQGTYTFTGYAVDSVGLKNQTETRSVTIDSLPPDVFSILPTSSSEYNVSSTIEIAANVTDDGSEIDYVLANVTFPNNTVQQLTLSNTIGDKYNSSFSLSTLTGTYSVLFIANDTFGNTNNTESTSFVVVNNIVPSIYFIDPTPSNNQNLTVDNIFVNLSSNSEGLDHYTFVDFDDRLTLWMRFDDTNSSGDPIDISTKGNNGSLSGDALINSTGKFGDALHLDGSGDFVNLPASNQLIPNGDVSWTMSTWFNANSIGSGDFDNRIITVRNAAGLSAISFTLGQSDRIQFFYRDGGGTGTTTDIRSISTGQWYHYAVSYNGTSFLIYVNGELNHTITDSMASTSSDTARVGANPSGSSEFFDGSIDDILLFDLSLPATDILSLFNASANQYGNNFTGLTQGTHNFTGYTVSTNGNKNQTEGRSVTIDTLAPEVTALIPSAGSTFNISTSVEIAANVTDSTHSVSYVFVNITFPNSTIQQLSLSNAVGDKYNSTFSIPQRTGTYSIQFIANDTFGNTNDTESTSFTVENPTLPSLNFKDPTPTNNTYQNKNNFPINISSTGNGFDHYTFTELNDDLILWMRFDNINESGHPLDISGRNNNGTLHGNPSITQGDLWGDLITFDGSSDYIDLQTRPSLNGPVNFTFSAWVNTSNTEMTIYNQRDAGGIHGEWIVNIGTNHAGTDDQPGKIYFMIYNEGFQFEFFSDKRVDDGEWHHIAVTRDGPNGYIYIDGVLNKSSSGTIKSVNDSLKSYIGADVRQGGKYFNGQMDDIILFNRSLSADEILSLYNATATQYDNNVTGLVDGVYKYTGFSVNKNGINQTETRQVTIDTVAPAVFEEITQPSTTFTFTDIIEIAANITDVNEITSTTINITYPNSTIIPLTITNLESNKYNTSITLNSIISTYPVRFIATDIAGNINSTQTTQFELANDAPDASAASVNLGSDITLSSAANTTITGTATIADSNGYGHISSVTGYLFLTELGISSNINLTNYYSTPCTQTSGSGVSADYNCTFNVTHFATPTDSGSNKSSTNWTFFVNATDNENAQGDNDTDVVDVNTLLSFTIDPSVIDFGELDLGENTTDINQNISVTNLGNTMLDIVISGTNLSCTNGLVPVNFLEYKDNPFEYGVGTDLLESGIELDLDVSPGSENTETPLKNTYYGLGIPQVSVGGGCNGTITITGTSDPAFD